MRLSLAWFGAALCASTVLAGNSPHKRNVFDRVNRMKARIEKKAPSEPFRHPELQKRATQFLTDKTKGML